jgi:hypothetical protein
MVDLILFVFSSFITLHYKLDNENEGIGNYYFIMKRFYNFT